MSKLVEKIISTGAIPAHAPHWAKLDDIQWIQKLDSIVKHPDKYRDSPLKRTLLKEAIKQNLFPGDTDGDKPCIGRYPFIAQDPVRIIEKLFGDKYENVGKTSNLATKRIIKETVLRYTSR